MSQIEDDIEDYLIYGDEFEGCYPMNKYCEICGSLMETKEGKHGKFRGCSNYPRCDWTEDFEECGEIIDNKKSDDLEVAK